VFSLRRSLLVVAPLALLLVVGGSVQSSPADRAVVASAHVARVVRKPLKPKARPRPVSADPSLPNDPLLRDSWSLAKVRAPAAWKVTRGTAEVVVAVLDTGVDANHPDLQGALVEGWDAVNEDADPNDDHGHGTLVAGVVAARSNNGIGGVGACSRCSVMPVKVIGPDGKGSAADITEGIIWAADHGARVINLSFVMSGRDEGIASALGYARSKGVLIVAAAGNSGSADVTFPAGEPGVVSVTGTDAADGRYAWANYGSWVMLAAPGCSPSTQVGGGYADFCGTSSAAAFASGVAGLARSASLSAPAEQIVAAMSSNAVRVGDFVATGRVDAAATMTTTLTVNCCPPIASADDDPDRPEPLPNRL
jgi:subtilisin family serine protease